MLFTYKSNFQGIFYSRINVSISIFLNQSVTCLLSFAYFSFHQHQDRNNGFSANLKYNLSKWQRSHYSLDQAFWWYLCRILKIGIHSKLKLLHKDSFESGYIILLIKNQHRFFIVNWILVERYVRQFLFQKKYRYWAWLIHELVG